MREKKRAVSALACSRNPPSLNKSKQAALGQARSPVRGRSKDSIFVSFTPTNGQKSEHFGVMNHLKRVFRLGCLRLVLPFCFSSFTSRAQWNAPNEAATLLLLLATAVCRGSLNWDHERSSKLHGDAAVQSDPSPKCFRRAQPVSRPARGKRRTRREFLWYVCVRFW